MKKLKAKIKQFIDYHVFEHHIKRALKGNHRVHLKYISYDNRGYGKTHTLIKLALKYNLPIICNSKIVCECVKKTSKICFNKYVDTYSVSYFFDNIRGLKFPSVMLVDEGIDKESIEILNAIIKSSLVGYKNFR